MNRRLIALVAMVCLGLGLQAAEADTLKSAFGKRFVMGAAIPGAGLKETELELLSRQFITLTPENCMKPGPIHPAEDRFDWTQADELVAMAQARGLTVNAHTLVWHQQCPDWFFADAGKPAGRELVLTRLRTHIATVAGRYAGKVASWDVVNEAIDDGKDYMRKSKWLASLGEDFIAEAFIAARQADPKAALYYNDYNIELGGKRAKTLRLIRDLKTRKVPIDGIGIQGHWRLDSIPFKDIEAAIIAFHAEGLKVAITELDLDLVPRQASGAATDVREKGGDDPYANGLPDAVQRRLADQYGRLFALFMKHQDKLARVSFWGLHDGRTWLNSWPRKRTNHPLLWDRALQAKPALAAVLAQAGN